MGHNQEGYLNGAQNSPQILSFFFAMEKECPSVGEESEAPGKRGVESREECMMQSMMIYRD